MSNNLSENRKTKLICFRVDAKMLEFIDMLAEYLNVDRSELLRIIINSVRLNFTFNRPLFIVSQIFEKRKGEGND